MTKLTFSPTIVRQAFEKFQATLSPELKAKLNGRLERGLDLALRGAVALHEEPGQTTIRRVFKVDSSDPSKPPYMVNLPARTCACPDHWKGHFCKHRIAAHVIELAMGMSQELAKPKGQDHTQRIKPANTIREAASAPAVPMPAKASRSTVATSIPTLNDTAQNALQGEAIIWAVIKHEGKNLGVEVLALDEDKATVRALPLIKDGSKIQPQFPFAEGKSSIVIIPASDLFHVKVFRHL